MEEAKVKQLLEQHLNKERKFWGSLFLVLFLFQMMQFSSMNLFQSPMSQVATEKVATVRGRRLLEVTESSSTVLPAPAPAPEGEFTELEDGREPKIGCDCPAGPRGPTGPAGRDAPEFLSSVFKYNSQTNTLSIHASMLELDGHIVVNGFAGIRESLFIGGDPSTGESSSELGPGTLMLYKSGGMPTITGFTTSSKGSSISNVTIIGGVSVLDDKTANLRYL